MILVLGGEGFVGQAYVRMLRARGLEHAVVTRATYDALRGTRCSLLINANGNSRKPLAEADPSAEFDASVRSVQRSLADFPADAYVFLSTGDVYPDTARPEVTDEGQALDPARVSRYGLHKHLAELLVRGAHPGALVVRMGGFVGPGLRKNAIFDMLTGGDVWLTPDSELQFISTDAAAALVFGMVEAGVRGEVVNLGGAGVVRLGEVHAAMNSASRFRPDARRVRFELATGKLERLAGVAPPRSTDEVRTFVAASEVRR